MVGRKGLIIEPYQDRLVTKYILHILSSQGDIPKLRKNKNSEFHLLEGYDQKQQSIILNHAKNLIKQYDSDIDLLCEMAANYFREKNLSRLLDEN